MVSKHSSSRDVRELRELRGLEFIEEEVELGGREGEERGGDERGGVRQCGIMCSYLGLPLGIFPPSSSVWKEKTERRREETLLDRGEDFWSTNW